MYDEYIAYLDSESKHSTEHIKLIIRKAIQNEKEYNAIEKRGSILCFAAQKQSEVVTTYIDSIRNTITLSEKEYDKYIDDSTIYKLTLLIGNCIDSSAKIISSRDWEFLQRDIYNTFWKDIPPYQTWHKTLFNYQPKKEAIALLASIKLNILITTEYTVHQAYLNNMFDRFTCMPIQVIALPNTSFVFNGEKAAATMFFAAYNWAIAPTITTNTKSSIKVKNRVSSLTTYAKTPGIKILSGTASIKIKDIVHTYPWQTQYYVAPKGIYMHVDNANRCYAGIPFTISIHVDDYSADKLSLRCKDAVINKIRDSIYTITTNKNVKACMLYMDAVNADGSISRSIAAKHIKVLQPMPDIAIGNIKHGMIAKAYIQQHASLSAIARDEELDITYRIRQYDISYIKADNKYIEPTTIQGSTLHIDNTLQSGDRMFITDIVATDNYGNTHHMAGTSFRIE
ncbi:hypothetical protein CAP35_11485 [Chitinophagaceae bacterium IBVUCB1]|nr:hypothetical protein CAP35_11485 [Chitinophagaceae bacterium IBVUCB1]